MAVALGVGVAVALGVGMAVAPGVGVAVGVMVGAGHVGGGGSVGVAVIGAGSILKLHRDSSEKERPTCASNTRVRRPPVPGPIRCGAIVYTRPPMMVPNCKVRRPTGPPSYTTRT